MSDIWLGTEESYRQALAGFQRLDAHQLQHGIKAGMDLSEEEDEDIKDYLQVVDGVAIINISGSLVNETLGWRGKYYGMTGYGDVQRAAVAAVRDPEVKSIMLNIKSGGGAVSGAQETAQLLSNIDKVKPITTYTSSYMGSAALWLGMAGREIVASETAIVGSIGTLIVMTSRHRMLQAEGIDAVVVRSGKYKALGQPVEPLTDEAVAQAQEKADYLADIFLGYVAQRRNLTKAAADSKFGQGREFIGSQAVSVGLIDRIQSYPEAFSRTKSLASTDNRGRIFGATMPTDKTGTYNPIKPKGQTSVQHIPTPEELAAMAGVDLTAETSTDVSAQAATTEPVAQTQPEVNAELVTALAELTTTKDTLAAVQAELAQTKEAHAAAAAQVTALAQIVSSSVKSMTLAIDGVACSDIAVADLAAKHAEVSAEFKTKYRAGRVSSTAAQATASKPAATAPLNQLFMAAAALRKSQHKGI